MQYIFRGYSYGLYTDIVHSYIEDLYDSSVEYYDENYGSVNPTGTEKLDRDKINEAVGFVEDYLAYHYEKYPDEFVNVFTTLNQKLNTVSVFPPRLRGLFGQYVQENNLLLINPQLSGSVNLTDYERTRLYVGHELGHIINSHWVNDAYEKLRIKSGSVVGSGIDLLDEAITQNRAEDFAYFFAKKRRPALTLHNYPSSLGRFLFDGSSYRTNYDFYGELQEISIMFSKTLRGIGKLNDGSEALKELSTRAFDSKFISNIIDEYRNDGHINDLVELLYYMGVVKNASYAMFGLGEMEDVYRSGDARNKIITLCSSLRDYREPIQM